jgi:membrane-associated protease RseP (regulator of RpoE activity)
MFFARRCSLIALVWLIVSQASNAHDPVAPGYLGLMLDDRPWNIGGVPVMRVHPRTPAEAAGFQVGDLVVSCNGARVESINDFARAIYQVGIGEQAVIQVQRGRQLFELTAVLSSGPNMPLENFRPPVEPEFSTDHLRDRRPILGLVVAAVQTRSYGLFGSLRQWGVIVEDIVPNSPAAQHRVPRGAILTSINGLPIRSTDDVFAIMEQVPVDRPVELTYIVGGSAYRQLVPLSSPEPRAVAKPLDEGVVIESPDVAPPAPEPSPDPLPDLPPPDPRPADEVRLPKPAAPTPEEVREMRSELEVLRRRAAEIQAEIDAIKRDASPPK